MTRKARYTPGLGCALCYPSLPPLKPQPPASPAASPAIAEAFDARLNELLDWAFAEPDPKLPRRTRAVVILRKGRVVGERYAPGFSRETPLLGWSMTKTVINALVGILVKDGRLSLDAPAPVPEWRGRQDPRCEITLDHLMRMSSGLSFQENYGDPLQDVTRMLLSVPDAAAFAAAKGLAAEPGSVWSYSSGTTNIISRAMRHVLGEAAYHAFPRTRLFDPLGMSSAVIEADASGTFVGSSFMYATARDWAKLGQLYLQDGVWEGARILPEGWVRYSTTPAPQAPDRLYGAHVWLKPPVDFSGGSLDSVPADAYHAVGHEGQLLTVIPSWELVVVRLGLTRHRYAWHHDVFIGKILQALS